MLRIGLAALLLAVTTGAGEPSEAFGKTLKSIRLQAKQGRWKLVDRRIRALIDEHKGKRYVLAERAELLDLIRKCAFRMKTSPPEPKSVVSGKLKSWNPRTGQIKIRYDFPKDRGDWQITKKLRVHPAVFRGPHRVSFWASGHLSVMVCMKRGRDIYVDFGSAGYLAQILDRRGSETVHRVQGDGIKAGVSPLRVVVKKQAVYALAKSAKLLTLAKSPRQWGQVAAFSTSISRIDIEGTIEPAWMQGLVDKKDSAALAAFAREYQPAEHVPAWLLKPATPAAASQRRNWPGTLGEAETALINKALMLQNKGRYAEAFALVRSARADQAVCHYLDALLSMGRNEYGHALEECEKLLLEDPEFLTGHTLRANLLLAVGRADEAVGQLQKLAQEHQNDPDLCAEAVRTLLRAGRVNVADKLLKGAHARGLNSRLLEQVTAMHTKARQGPAWNKSFEVKSRHYRVLSDIDQKTCSDAARFLEQAHARFVNNLERGSSDRRRFVVYIFSGEAGYMHYCSDLLGMAIPKSGGVYIPLLKQLAVWTLDSRETMLKVVRHEGFHQYLDRIMYEPPAWFNEGMAVYYGTARVVKGTWRLGELSERIWVLKKKPMMPLSRFLYLSHREFMADAGLHYAQAWAFMHFLQHSTRENKELFGRFWKAFKTVPSQRRAVKEALGDRPLDGLQEAFRAHVAQLNR